MKKRYEPYPLLIDEVAGPIGYQSDSISMILAEHFCQLCTHLETKSFNPKDGVVLDSGVLTPQNYLQ